MADSRPPRRPRGGGDRPVAVVTPDYWNFRGETVVEGRKRLLVWQGIPGEQARVRVIHQGRNQDRGRWLSSRRPDRRRVEPACERYTPCGGCPLMHLNDRGQRDVRRGLVAAALAEAGVELEVEPVVPAPSTRDFRHLIKVGFGYSDIGRPRMGAFGRASRDLVPIPKCLVATPTLREVMKIVAHHFIDLDIRPFVPERGGLLRYMVARQSAHSGEVLITLVAARNHRLLRQLAEAIEQNCAAVVGVHLHLNDGPGNAIFDRDGQGVVGTSRLVGRMTITDRIAGVDYRIGPGDFFQTHPAMADRLYRDVIAMSTDGGMAGGVPVVDLYAGVGGFALALAPKCGWAVGVEGVEGAVRRARESASAGEISAEFTCGEVLDVLPELARRLKGRRPLVVLNPARRGLEDGVIDGVMALDPRRIIYVSCNPQALGRDLRAFMAAGWTAGAVRPYDMFPNTAHVEVVCDLRPPDGGRAPTLRSPRRKVIR